MQRATRGTMRTPHPLPAPAPPRGVTLIGLLAWAIVVGFVGYLLVRVVPTLTEFYPIQGVVVPIAGSPANTGPGTRPAFEKQRQIDATITSVEGKELDITKENDRVVISFAYEKEIELVGPVFLLIKYAGRSK